MQGRGAGSSQGLQGGSWVWWTRPCPQGRRFQQPGVLPSFPRGVSPGGGGSWRAGLLAAVWPPPLPPRPAGKPCTFLLWGLCWAQRPHLSCSLTSLVRAGLPCPERRGPLWSGAPLVWGHGTRPGAGGGAPRGDPAWQAAADGPPSAGPPARCAGGGTWAPGSCRLDGCVVGGGPSGRRCQLAALPGPAGARFAVEKQLGPAWPPASATAPRRSVYPAVSLRTGAAEGVREHRAWGPGGRGLCAREPRCGGTHSCPRAPTTVAPRVRLATAGQESPSVRSPAALWDGVGPKIRTVEGTLGAAALGEPRGSEQRGPGPQEEGWSPELQPQPTRGGCLPGPGALTGGRLARPGGSDFLEGAPQDEFSEGLCRPLPPAQGQASERTLRRGWLAPLLPTCHPARSFLGWGGHWSPSTCPSSGPGRLWLSCPGNWCGWSRLGHQAGGALALASRHPTWASPGSWGWPSGVGGQPWPPSVPGAWWGPFPQTPPHGSPGQGALPSAPSLWRCSLGSPPSSEV